METAGFIRNAVGLGRSGAVRRFLNDIGSRFSAPPELPAARDTHWGETRWDAAPAKTSGRRKEAARGFQQVELWDNEDEHAEHEGVGGAFGEAPVRDAAPITTRMDELDELRAAREEHKENARILGLDQRSVRMADIAKFLQVNHAVDGLDADANRFSLPHRTFAAKFSLWKGSSAGTPFLTGC